jgi:hypothetical protein
MTTAGPRTIATSTPSLQAQVTSLLAGKAGQAANQFLPGSGTLVTGLTKNVVGVGGKALSSAAGKLGSGLKKLKFW